MILSGVLYATLEQKFLKRREYMGTNQGETDLKKMLANLQPILSEERYVYCFHAYPFTPDFPVWASICEQEGMTVIMAQAEADRQAFAYEGLWACITLSVHSSLQAVGLGVTHQILEGE